ncbi:glycosyltransferase [Kitasatospora sp. MBT66]|uniref:glycosyltransferase family 2 protein n=1 Tax=Kitasatospora sp. MBT66 TaxID=1444769 RepID=UPI0007C6DA01|nr:glycosyltransferase [Kitasatospora sp. MBT66]
MPTISVITPVYNGGHEYLAEAYRSLCEQELPDGWNWQWIVQEDGESGAPASLLPEDSRISAGVGPRGGAAMARTMGLTRVTGSLVRSLDADDILPVGALARAIQVMTSHAELGWCVGSCLDLLPDGTLAAGPCDPEAGLLPPGMLADGLRAGQLQVMGTTMTIRTDLLRSLGGWPALPAGEDVGVLLAAEAVSPGWMISEPVEVYRKHPGQLTGTSEFRDAATTVARHEAILGRADALHRSGWKWEQPIMLSPFERKIGESQDPKWDVDRRVEIHTAVNAVIREAADIVGRRSRGGRWTPPGEMVEGGSNGGLISAARVWVLDRLDRRVAEARETLNRVEGECLDYTGIRRPRVGE